MSKPNRRVVRMQQFKQQISEAVLPDDSLVEIDLDNGESVWIKLPVNLDEDDDYLERVKEAAESGDGEKSALVALGERDGVSAETQWEKWKAAGYDARDLAMVIGSEIAAARERLAAFRYRG